MTALPMDASRSTPAALLEVYLDDPADD